MASKPVLRVIGIEEVERGLSINTVRRPPNHKCSDCGRRYYRRNLMEQWVGRNEGHRYGWHKEIVKTCTGCTDIAESKRIIGIADVRFGRMKIESRASSPVAYSAQHPSKQASHR